MRNQIPKFEVDSLLSRVKAEMSAAKFPQDIIDKTRIKVIHPDYWEVSIFVPCQSAITPVRTTHLRRNVQGILFNRCNVDAETCDFFGKEHSKDEYEWYFRHPNIPKEINALIDAENEAENMVDDDSVLPIPIPLKSDSDTAFITLKDKFFKEIDCGKKTVEYRDLNQYYCDKFFPSGVMKKFVKMNRGYQSGRENQMLFEISDIVLVGLDGRECPTLGSDGKYDSTYSQIPKGFKPIGYGIKLGRRIA